MRITNIQKRTLSEIFKKNNLDLIDFETTGSYHEFNVKFKHDYFSFNIKKIKDDLYALSILNIDRKTPYNFNENWTKTVIKFSDWTKSIVNEINSLTGWETFENTNFLNTEFSELDEKFTETEKEVIMFQISELKSKISKLELPTSNYKIIENKLDFLISKIDEQNKFDWKSQFIGTIASLILTLIIPPDLSGVVWEYIKVTFNNLKLSN